MPSLAVGALNPLLTLGSDKLKSKIIFAGYVVSSENGKPAFCEPIESNK